MFNDEKFTGPAEATLKLVRPQLSFLITYDLPGRGGLYRGVSLGMPLNWRDYGANPSNELRIRGVSTYDGATPPTGERVLGDENWMGFSVKVPAATSTTGTNITLCQWHAGESGAPPHLSLRVADDGRFYLLLRAAPVGVEYNGPVIVQDRWYDFVIHTKWASTPTGFVQLWLDGVLLADYAGATVREPSDASTTYCKFGLYIPTWRTVAGDQQKTLLFSALRFAGSDSSRAEVDPDQSPVTAIQITNSTTRPQSGSSTASFSHNHPAGTDNAIIVLLSGMRSATGDNPFTFTTVTFDGEALTLLGYQQNSSTNRNMTTAIFYKAGVSAVTGTVAVTSSTIVSQWYVRAISVTGVDQTTALTLAEQGTAVAPWASTRTVAAGSQIWWVMTARGDSTAVEPGTGNEEEYDTTQTTGGADTDLRAAAVYRAVPAGGSATLTIPTGPQNTRRPTWLFFVVNAAESPFDLALTPPSARAYSQATAPSITFTVIPVSPSAAEATGTVRKPAIFTVIPGGPINITVEAAAAQSAASIGAVDIPNIEISPAAAEATGTASLDDLFIYTITAGVFLTLKTRHIRLTIRG